MIWMEGVAPLQEEAGPGRDPNTLLLPTRVRPGSSTRVGRRKRRRRKANKISNKGPNKISSGDEVDEENPVEPAEHAEVSFEPSAPADGPAEVVDHPEEAMPVDDDEEQDGAGEPVNSGSAYGIPCH